MALQTATLAESESGGSGESGESGESRNGLRRRLLHSPLTLTGLVITLVFVVLAIIGPWISPYDPSAVGDAALAGPSAAHWLGTTQNGQDVFSQISAGSATRCSHCWRTCSWCCRACR